MGNSKIRGFNAKTVEYVWWTLNENPETWVRCVHCVHSLILESLVEVGRCCYIWGMVIPWVLGNPYGPTSGLKSGECGVGPCKADKKPSPKSCKLGANHHPQIVSQLLSCTTFPITQPPAPLGCTSCDLGTQGSSLSPRTHGCLSRKRQKTVVGCFRIFTEMLLIIGCEPAKR